MDVELLRNLPPVTRAWLGITAGLALLVTGTVVSEQSIVFIPARISAGEIWRVVTSIVYLAPLDTEFLMCIGLYITPFQWLETGYYANTRAFCWRIVQISMAALMLCSYLGLRSPCIIVLTALEYLYSRLNTNNNAIAVWLFLRLPDGVTSFHHILKSLIMRDSQHVWLFSCGVALGHTVLLLDHIYPKVFGRRPLAYWGEPPTFL